MQKVRDLYHNKPVEYCLFLHLKMENINMQKEPQSWNIQKGDYRPEDEYARIYNHHRKKEKIVKNTFLAFTVVAVASLMYLVLWYVSKI